MAAERPIGSKGKPLWGMPGKHLPELIVHVYNDLVESGKHSPGGPTYRLAVGIVKNWARGEKGAKPETVAKARAAMDEWDKLRAEAKARESDAVVATVRARLEEKELSAKGRNAFPDSAFVFPKERRYPIYDLAHAQNALARSSGKPEEARVRAAVYARYPKLKEAWSDEARAAALAARKGRSPEGSSPATSMARTSARSVADRVALRASHGRVLSILDSIPSGGSAELATGPDDPDVIKVHRHRGRFVLKKNGVTVSHGTKVGVAKHYVELTSGLAEAGREQPRQAGGKYTDRHRGQTRPARTAKELMADVAAAGHAGGGICDRCGTDHSGPCRPKMTEAWSPQSRAAALVARQRKAGLRGGALAKGQAVDHGVLESHGASLVGEGSWSKHVAASVEKLHGKDPTKVDTVKLHTDPRTGAYTPERRALHRRIIALHLRGHAPAVKGRETVFLGGGAAAGKSSIVKSGAASVPKDHVLINPDVVKGMIPEYKHLTGRQDRGASGHVHEESSHVAEMIRTAALKRGHHVVVDKVRIKPGHVEESRASGYKVRGLVATTPVHVAIDRAEVRGQKNGRFVHEKHLRTGHADVSREFPGVAKKTGMHIEVHDTYRGVKLATAEGGKITVHHKAGYREFLAKGKA